MQRDHMMGWVMPAEPLGPAIRPLQAASKAQNEASLKEFAMLSFEQGDHMLPGMRQKDFPKEYDTAAAIEDRSMEAYNRAMWEMAGNMVLSRAVAFGYDAGAPGANETASGLSLLMSAGEERHRRIMAALKPKPIMWDDWFK